MTKKLFLDILKFCIQENRYFIFGGNTYKQLKGMPMSSPASPVVADIIMEHCLDECVQQLREKPRFLTKYVDDLFARVKIDNIDETLEILNNFHKDIKFTMEKEKNGQLPYLDTLL